MSSTELATVDSIIIDSAIQGLSTFQMKQIHPEAFAQVPDAYIIGVLAAHRQEIDQGRATQDQVLSYTHPLSSKTERLKALCDFAESIRAKAQESGKWATEYRLTLAEIRREYEALDGGIRPDDPWVLLLKRLVGAAKSLDEGEPDSEADYIEGTWAQVES